MGGNTYMKIISEYPELKGVVFDTVEACELEEKKIDKIKADNEAKKQAEMKEQNAKKTALRAELEQLAKVKNDAHEKFFVAKKTAQETIEKANADVTKAYAEFQKAVRAYNDKTLEYNQLTGNVHNADRKEFTPEELFKAFFGI